jgi:hypothetical protein
MPILQDFLAHPIENLERALHIRKRIEQLNATLKDLFGPTPISLASIQMEIRKRLGKRTLSSEARAKIAAAQKARWSKHRKGRTPAGGGGRTKKQTKPAVSPAGSKKKGRGLSAEGRARIAAAQKARWAKARKAKG